MWKVLLEMILLDLVKLSSINEEGTAGDDPIGFGGPKLYKCGRYFWR